MLRSAVVIVFILIILSLPVYAQVQDEWSPYIDRLNDLTAEVNGSLAGVESAMGSAELAIRAGLPREEYATEVETLKKFLLVLDRVNTYFADIAPKLADWQDRFDDYSPLEQARITEVRDAYERLSMIYDSYVDICVSIVTYADAGAVPESLRWRFNVTGDVYIGEGQAYGNSQHYYDGSVGLKWERTDGLILEYMGRVENNHRYNNTGTFTNAFRQKFNVPRGDVTLRQRFQQVDGLDNARISRDEWSLDADYNQDYGMDGSYFRFRGTLLERNYDNNASRSYDFNRIFGFIHHEVAPEHSAEAEYTRYEYSYTTGSMLSQTTRNYRLGWESQLPRGIILNADYLNTDRNFPNIPSFGFNEDAWQLGARWNYSSQFGADFRYRTTENNKSSAQQIYQGPSVADDYNERRMEARFYIAPQEDLSFNLRGLVRDRNYATANPYQLDEKMIELLATYYPARHVRLFADGRLRNFDYVEPRLSFDRQEFRAGFTYSFRNMSSVGAEFKISDQLFDIDDSRDFTIKEFQASYNKYWRYFRLRVLAGVTDLSQEASASPNIHTTDRLSAEFSWYPNEIVRFALGTDYLGRHYANQPDITDWMLYARMGFSF